MKSITKQKRRKLEKKRRKDKEKRKLTKAQPLAYTGNKYRTQKYVLLLLATESAINEANVISDRSLTDSEVKGTVIEMIGRLRRGPMPALADMSEEERQSFGQNDFLIWNIISRWQRYFEEHEPLGKDALIGVLRTILDSLDCHRSNSPSASGYLEFLEDFLARMGVSTRQVSREEVEELGLDVDEIDSLPYNSPKSHL